MKIEGNEDALKHGSMSGCVVLSDWYA